MRRAGFTTFEVLICVLLIGVVASGVVLRYGAFAQARRLEAAAQRVAADIAAAQQRARHASAPVTIDFRPGSDAYGVTRTRDLDRSSGAYVVKLAAAPYEVDLYSADFAGGLTLGFNGYGVPTSAGVVRLRLGDRALSVNVAANGSVTLQ